MIDLERVAFNEQKERAIARLQPFSADARGDAEKKAAHAELRYHTAEVVKSNGDHGATGAACGAFRAVMSGPRFLRLRRE